MLKWLLLLVVAVVAGAYGYYYFSHPETRACSRYAELCATERDSVADLRARCEQQVSELRRGAGAAAVDKGSRCVEGSRSCAEAVGCVVGSTGDALRGAAKDFLQGVKRAVVDDK